MLARLRTALDGLAFRIAALLALALFPIGLIAISLSGQLARDSELRNEMSLLALTSEAATREGSSLTSGFGILAALTAALPAERSDDPGCSKIFEQFLRLQPDFSFAGYIDRNGIIACGSEAVGRDVSDRDTVKIMRQEQSQRIDLIQTPAVSNQTVLVMSRPVFLSGRDEYDGFVAISVPEANLFEDLMIRDPAYPTELITFNKSGQVLTTKQNRDDALKTLPRNVGLDQFVGNPRQAFSALSREGQDRIYAVVPIVEGTAYAMGSWLRSDLSRPRGSFWSSPLVFPALMWLSSLCVAFLAVHRLAIAHIRRLGRNMDDFRQTRALKEMPNDFSVPLEIRRIYETWYETAATILRDEAEMESVIRSKTALLKEVHHRVKNNLQLVASILNMRIRRANNNESRIALREVQRRVMSIATVHRALYETSTEGVVNANELLGSVIGKTIEGCGEMASDLEIEIGFADVPLYPDQAVPLSLMASEAATNAIKHLGRPSTGRAPRIWARLDRAEGDRAVLEIGNTKGALVLPREDMDTHSGMGSKLINAFAVQMRGELEISDSEHEFSVRMTFAVTGFSENAVDYSI